MFNSRTTGLGYKEVKCVYTLLRSPIFISSEEEEPKKSCSGWKPLNTPESEKRGDSTSTEYQFPKSGVVLKHSKNLEVGVGKEKWASLKHKLWKKATHLPSSTNSGSFYVRNEGWCVLQLKPSFVESKKIDWIIQNLALNRRELIPDRINIKMVEKVSRFNTVKSRV